MMKVWWENLSDREHRVVNVGAVIVVLLLFYAFIWSPLSDAVSSISTQVVSQQRLFQWMQRANINIQRLHEAGFREVKSTQNSILVIVEKTLSEQKLSIYLNQVQQPQSNQVELVFKHIPFDQFISRLQNVVKRNDIVVVQMKSDKTAVAGVVHIQVTLKK